MEATYIGAFNIFLVTKLPYNLPEADYFENVFSMVSKSPKENVKSNSCSIFYSDIFNSWSRKLKYFNDFKARSLLKVTQRLFEVNISKSI